MDYTSSNAFATDAGTGQRLHDGAAAVTTAVSDLDMNGLIWEALALIKAGGVAPLAFDKTVAGTYKQLAQAVKRLAGANVRTISAVGPTALTADDAGLILLDATANAVTVTLPAANAATAVPLNFQFVRIDTTANAVTVNRAGADTFVGGATSFVLSGQGDLRAIRSDSTSKWATTGLSGLGYSQAWQNVLGSRAVGTNYTNSTGRPIEVLVMANTTASAGAVLTSVVAGVTLGSFAGLYSASGGASAIAQFVVPPGAVYSVAMSGAGSPVLASWVELR